MLLPRTRCLRWSGSAAIVLSLSVAGLLAVGHHLFYADLDGTPVSTESYSIGDTLLLRQQVNSAAGVALAFLVRLLLSITVSTAYFQFFWRGVGTTQQPPTLAELDWASSITDNVLEILNLSFWRNHPGLVTLAILFWCLPIATIFPPAALSVVTVFKNTSSMLQVPQVDFTTFKFAAASVHAGSWFWSGPSQAAQFVALKVSTAGQVSPFLSPAPNATWTLDFQGPELRCNDVPDSKKDQILVNIWNSYEQSIGDQYAFLSWVPWSAQDYVAPTNGSGVWLANLTNVSDPYLPFLFDFQVGPEVRIPTAGPSLSKIPIDGSLSLFIAVLPNGRFTNFLEKQDIGNEQNFSGTKITFLTLSDLPHGACHYRRINHTSDVFSGCDNPSVERFATLALGNATVLQCDLFNKSYTVDFNFTNGKQNLRTRSDQTDKPEILTSSRTFLSAPNCSSFQIGSPDGQDPRNVSCNIDVSALHLMSYQSLMAAFNKLITGSILIEMLALDEIWDPTNLTDKELLKYEQESQFIKVNTTVLNTVLKDTHELASLRDSDNVLEPYDDNIFTSEEAQLSLDDYKGMVGPVTTSTRGNLGPAVHELFQNLTLSLMMEPYFQPNWSSALAPPQRTNVTLPIYEITYSYNPRALWIAYGLSIFFTTLIALAGITLIVVDGASYDYRFSTILRMVKTSPLDTEIGDQKSDGFGRSPLPKHLKNARLDIWSEKRAKNASSRRHFLTFWGRSRHEAKYQELVALPKKQGEQHPREATRMPDKTDI